MTTLAPKTPDESKLSLAVVMGVQDSNTLGNVHGGVLMKLCDEAGGLCAAKHARRPCVTVAVDRMTFNAPVHLGNVVTFSARVTWVGRTSVETEIIVCAEDIVKGEVTHTNTAHFVYVALDENGKSTPVPPLELVTEEDHRRYAEAEQRQAFRLQLREQGKRSPVTSK